VAGAKKSVLLTNLAFKGSNISFRMGGEDDHYKTLGLDPDASSIDIKKAYRKLALQFHPDKQAQSSDAERESASSQFAKIAAAYEILSDDEERKQYDMRRKYGGAPGTRYTTCDSPCNSPGPTSPSRPKHSSSRPAKAESNHTSTAPSSFQFSYDPTKVKSRDPQAIFREVFGKDFNAVYPDATMTTSSVPKSPSTPGTKGKKVATTSPSPGRTKTDVRVRSPSTKTPTQSSSKKAPIHNGHEDIMSMSSSTRTVVHADGSHEVITETTIIKKDGSKQTSMESSRSTPSKVKRQQVQNTPRQTTTYIKAL
jgi:DnaJ-domain-containing protein 1